MSRVPGVLQPLAAQWNLWRSNRAGTRELPYLESRITINGWDLEQRARQPVTDERQLPASVRLWRSLTALGPALAIDVGANYGAFTLAGRYPEGTQCVAFEPNPDVWRCLDVSIRTHPDAARIELHRLAASDASGAVAFHIDTLKSGCSSMHQSPRFRGAVRSVSTDLATLDGFLSARFPRANELVLIKTDTEGNDFRVLVGARHLLDSATRLIGFCEFAPDLLTAAGTSPAEFLAFLTARYRVWWIRDKPAPCLSAVSGPADAMLTGNLVYSTEAEAVEAAAVSLQIPIR